MNDWDEIPMKISKQIKNDRKIYYLFGILCAIIAMNIVAYFKIRADRPPEQILLYIFIITGAVTIAEVYESFKQYQCSKLQELIANLAILRRKINSIYDDSISIDSNLLKVTNFKDWRVIRREKTIDMCFIINNAKYMFEILNGEQDFETFIGEFNNFFNISFISYRINIDIKYLEEEEV